jgi:hypothetical protein
MVTLPRIKGETATERNDRVAREKSAALARQCDFCAQTVEVVALTNGAHAVGLVAEPEPVVETIAAIEEAIAVVAPVKEEIVVVEPVAEEAIVVIEPLAEPQQTIAVVEPVAQAEETVVMVTPEEEIVVVVEPVELPIAAPRAKATRKRQVRTPEAIARGRQFLVEYQVERVLHAVDIHDALRKATALGASQLVAITRED